MKTTNDNLPNTAMEDLDLASQEACFSGDDRNRYNLKKDNTKRMERSHLAYFSRCLDLPEVVVYVCGEVRTKYLMSVMELLLLTNSHAQTPTPISNLL